MLSLIGMRDDTRVMDDSSPFLEYLGECYMLYADLHKSVRSLVHHVREYVVFQIFLHLRDINDSPFRQFLKLLIVNISRSMARMSPLSKDAGFSMKESLVAAEVNRTSDGTPSLAWITVCAFMPPFLLPVFG